MPNRSLSSVTVPTILGVPQELSDVPSSKGAISLSYHSDRSPSAPNPAGLPKEIVGIPLAVLVIAEAAIPASPTFSEASLQLTA